MARVPVISTYRVLLGLVAMLIADVHAKWTAGSPARAIFFSSLQGCTRHALPSPENGQYHHQPHQLLRSGRILAKHAKAIGRQAVDWNLVVSQLFKALLSAALKF